MRMFPAHLALRLKHSSISLLSDSLVDPEEFSADESLLEIELEEPAPVRLFSEGEGLLSRVCLVALLRSTLKTSKLVSQAFDKKFVKLPVRRFLPA